MSGVLARRVMRKISVSSFACVRWFPVQTGRSFSVAANEKQTTTDKPEEYYDVIIAGGGMVGTTLACALGKNSRLSDRKILLLEAAKSGFKPPASGFFSNRVSALSHGTQRLMQSIGAWQQIESVRAKPVLKMQVWDACSDALITFNYDDLSENIAWIVENDVLLGSVYQQLEQVKNVEIRYGAKVEECVLMRDGANRSKVRLSNGDLVGCELLIGADGYNSLVRRAMGSDNFSIGYNQMGLVATLKLDPTGSSGNATAWQRFLPTGPIAMLPLADDVSSMVWSTSVPEAKRLMQLDEKAFVAEVNAAFNKQYPKNNVVSEVLKQVNSFVSAATGQKLEPAPMVQGIFENSRGAFPLALGHTSTYVGQGVCLVGDAAHRVHPLAGQGVNLGFGDVQCLTNVLGEANYSGLGLNNLSQLVRYEQERLKHNVPVLATVHGLQRLYNTDFPPIVGLRSVGLTITNALPVVKKFLMNRAMS
ncbi:ubiquinone biosynthesis monooxygenase COQ6, mitochondrial [Uranotaenia lowii]|uniref:ubiquinone biosynthesis monooxygenase COQ6, mitochondrial n=1 Tax=Uranotaenia lowii TaxID=190385 RepID=UPI00247AE474|nr:ubiquinone biosynthesis monooxygenase COQ6, mitochondrial [Uranotaenia lowii]